MILAENTYLSEGYKENQNILVLGVPGSGKTRGHSIPYLMDTENSCVVLDPKGELYATTEDMMRKKGYKVILLDFMNPGSSPNTYNPLEFMKSETDILTFTELLLAEQSRHTSDSFWPSSARVLSNALTAYLLNECNLEDRTLGNFLKLLNTMTSGSDGKSTADILFEDLEKKDKDCFAVQSYNIIKNVNSAEKTHACIVISLAVAFSAILSPEVKKFTAKTNFNIVDIGHEKTAVYIKSSDTDRSLDYLVNLFFRQVFDVLTKEADKCENGVLPVHVHFILDDFGTNLTINNFDSFLAGCRSREMSCSVILQSAGQLKTMYGYSWQTIFGSCKSYVFLGSNDIETCQDISLRMDKPLMDILYKPIEDIYIFTQGEKPIVDKRYDITQHRNYKFLNTIEK